MPRLLLYFVYGLTDPRFNGPLSVRYIGITINPNERYKAHLNCPQYDPVDKNAWVQDVLAAGLEPGIEIFEVFRTSQEKQEQLREARMREAYWIHYYMGLGADLLNVQIENRAYDPIEELLNSPEFNGILLGGEPD